MLALGAIDLHTHILPERWPDLRERYGCGGWVTMEHCGQCRARMMIDGALFREVESNLWDPTRRMGECDQDGVGVQVLSTVPVMFAYGARAEHAHDLAQLLNDHLAGVVRSSPARFVGLGTVPLQDATRAVRELERCVRELRLPGVQIGTNVAGRDLDDPAIAPFFAAAEDLGAAIFVHPWEMFGRAEIPASGCRGSSECRPKARVRSARWRSAASLTATRDFASASRMAAVRSPTRSAASSMDSRRAPTCAPRTPPLRRARICSGCTSTASCMT